ncbi:MAG: hypothetical protein WKG01_33210 [Kofleriaceae bacterium]
MADLSSLLAVLEHDPDDAQALEALAGAARHTPPDVRASRFDQARKVIGGRGRPDTVVKLLDLELESTGDADRKVDLMLEKGMVLDGELLDVADARTAFEEVLRLRPDDTMAQEAIAELELAAGNWQKFADKYVQEASGSTDRSLATALFVSAAEAYVRFAPESKEAEHHLRKALEIDPRNARAAFHLARLLKRTGRTPELVKLLEDRAEVAPATEDRIAALIALLDLARSQHDDARAEAVVKRVLVLDPAQPQALRAVTDAFIKAQNWLALVQAYQAALKARRDADDLGMLLQIAMVLWKHVGDLDQAEEYFRRVRKLEPAHPAALDFYRVYYPAKGEHQKLLALLRQVERSNQTPRARSESNVRPIGVEIAELAEAQNNPEKAIEAWKQVVRLDPATVPAEALVMARHSLARLYRKTEKWNALLDLMKEEIERLPETDVAGRVGKLHEVVEIYRDKLRLDVMVINTYNAILKIDPDNRRATDELASKFRALGRWNDLIAVLTRKSEVADVPDGERIALLREIADLWAERFGNFANAIKPLEKIVELAPGTPEFADALMRLKEIYTKRRQWRALIDVLGREANALPPDEKRAKQSEMARLSAERLGDTRLAIEIYNGILASPDLGGPDQGDTLQSLAALYDREKRWLALAEILHRQVASAKAPGGNANREAVTLYEKLGQIYADRLGSPQLAASAWQEVLELEPGHARALRTLRELYATAGDFTGLERLYARLGQEEELVDALLGIADRIESKASRLPLVERAAQLAQQRADATSNGEAAPAVERPARQPGKRSRSNTGESAKDIALERARQVWERVLAVEPQHVPAAAALGPIYTRQEKWAKLITVLEIELGAAKDVPARLAKIAEIRALCEQKLTSRTLAFTWTLRAFDLDPENPQLYADVMRLASEPDQWREVVATFEKHVAPTAPHALPDEIRLKLYRELAKIASRRLADAERARTYHRQVLTLASDDRDAEQSLEELAIQLADWPELLASYRRRAAREKDATMRASLLIEIASLQEEKLVDLDGAAATYREALTPVPGQIRALRALARIEEARGDWDSLANVLASELQQTPDGQARFDLLMRLGALHDQSLESPRDALPYYRDALAVPASGGGVRPRPSLRLRGSCSPAAAATSHRGHGSDRRRAHDPAAPRVREGPRPASPGTRSDARGRRGQRRRATRDRSPVDADLSHRPRRPGRGVDRRAPDLRGRTDGRRGPASAIGARGPARSRRRMGAPPLERARDAAPAGRGQDDADRRGPRARHRAREDHRRAARRQAHRRACVAERARGRGRCGRRLRGLDRDLPRGCPVDRSARLARAPRRGLDGRPRAARGAARARLARGRRARPAVPRGRRASPRARDRSGVRRVVSGARPPADHIRELARARGVARAPGRSREEPARAGRSRVSPRRAVRAPAGRSQPRRRSARGRDHPPARPCRRARAARGAAAAARGHDARGAAARAALRAGQAVEGSGRRAAGAARAGQRDRGGRAAVADRRDRGGGARRTTQRVRCVDRGHRARPDARARPRRAGSPRAAARPLARDHRGARDGRRGGAGRRCRHAGRAARRARGVLRHPARRCTACDHGLPPAARDRSVQPSRRPQGRRGARATLRGRAELARAAWGDAAASRVGRGCR